MKITQPQQSMQSAMVGYASRAPASGVSVVDSGGFFTADDVEDILAEIGVALDAAPVVADYPFHDEPLTDGASNFIFMAGDIIVLTGVPN